MCEWDARKAAVNAMKHGVTFGEAATVFDDPQGLDGPDLAHSERERRYRRLGRTASGRLLIRWWRRRRPRCDMPISYASASARQTVTSARSSGFRGACNAFPM